MTTTTENELAELVRRQGALIERLTRQVDALVEAAQHTLLGLDAYPGQSRTLLQRAVDSARKP